MAPIVHTTTVDEGLFERLNGQHLLHSIRDNNLTATKDRLGEVLYTISLEYTTENPKETKNLRRLAAMKVYNNLLLIALGAEKKDLKLWATGDSVENLLKKKSVELLGSGSIFKHLLDDIHEHEDIMFKYYAPEKRSPQSWREQGLHWLVDSLEMYRTQYLVNPILDIVLDPLIGENDEMLARARGRAKKEFQAKVPVERSWRYKARMYWLLAREKHVAPVMSHGTQPAKSKSFDYCGPIGTLVQELITDDNKVLLEKDGDSLICHLEKDGESLIYKPPQMKIAEKNGLKLGIFMKSSSLLAYASAKNDHVLVKCILQSKEQFEKHDEYNCDWEVAWKQTWAYALWNAAYKGSGRVVEELLKYSSLYSPEQCNIPDDSWPGGYNPDKSVQPPLHVAVHMGRISVVDAFCSAEYKYNLSCSENDHQLLQTPLEVTSFLKDKRIKKKIQSMLLRRAEVKEAVKEWYTQRDLTVSSANAIMVGAALIASVTYAGWLQPPLGYHDYYQFSEPVPGAPDAPESYMFVQGHTTIRVFAIFNSLSFFFAIAAILSGLETFCFVADVEDTFITEIVSQVRYEVKRTRISFIASVIFVLIAFSSAAIAIVPPIRLYQRDIYITIGLGGFICLPYIYITLISISNWITDQLGRILEHMKPLFERFEKKLKFYLEESN